MPEKAVRYAAGFLETVALVESYCGRILRVHSELKLMYPVSECVFCHIAQEICSNPGPSLMLPDIDADKPRTVRHFTRTLAGFCRVP